MGASSSLHHKPPTAGGNMGGRIIAGAAHMRVNQDQIPGIMMD